MSCDKIYRNEFLSQYSNSTLNTSTYKMMIFVTTRSIKKMVVVPSTSLYRIFRLQDLFEIKI